MLFLFLVIGVLFLLILRLFYRLQKMDSAIVNDMDVRMSELMVEFNASVQQSVLVIEEKLADLTTLKQNIETRMLDAKSIEEDLQQFLKESQMKIQFMRSEVEKMTNNSDLEEKMEQLEHLNHHIQISLDHLSHVSSSIKQEVQHNILLHDEQGYHDQMKVDTPNLDERFQQVKPLIKQGFSISEVADQLQLTEKQVRFWSKMEY